jgi:ParB-like chromosome segregation protein Spo0J
MARAKDTITVERSLYERDFNLWVEQQVALLESGAFKRLDLANLMEEIADMARSQKRAIRSDLVVLLTHLLKWRQQPDNRSTGWAGSIVEHRRRIREEIEDSPSLAGYPGEVFERCYRAAREQAAAETGLPKSRFPESSPYTLEQTLDPDFLPD